MYYKEEIGVYMKLPLTDKFLWSLYNLLEEVDDAFAMIFPSREFFREARYHDLYKLKRAYEKEKSRKYFGQFIYYLKKQGYIKIKNLEQKKGVMITRKGLQKAVRVKFKIKEKRVRKDGKYQMVIFDIPERKRKLREIFREYLQILGYRMFQQSVWICPYDVYKETEEIVRKFSLDPYVRFFLIKEIEI